MCKLEALHGLFSQETVDAVLRDLGLVLGAAAAGGQVPAHMRAAVLLKVHRLLLLSFDQVRAEDGGRAGRQAHTGRGPLLPGGHLPNRPTAPYHLPDPVCCLLPPSCFCLSAACYCLILPACHCLP